MIHRIAAMCVLLLSTAGCGLVGDATVTYLRSPNGPPPPGTVYVDSLGGYTDPAYAWLALYGYEKAPSSDSATYLVHLDEGVGTYVTLCSEGVDETFTQRGRPVFLGDGDVKCGDMFGPELHVVMERRVEGQAQTIGDPLVEISAVTFANTGPPPFPPAIAARLSDFAFGGFPGVAGTTKTLFLQVTQDQVCVIIGSIFLRDIHCRPPDAVPAVLPNAPAS
jgi:hypothetical protein